MRVNVTAEIIRYDVNHFQVDDSGEMRLKIYHKTVSKLIGPSFKAMF